MASESEVRRMLASDDLSPEAREALTAYRRGFNRAVYGRDEPTAAQVGHQWDIHYGTWLPKTRPTA